MAGLTGGTLLILVLLALVVGVLWIFLPFSVFGTKPLLRQLIAQQQRTNALLEQLQPRADSGSLSGQTPIHHPGRFTG